jgi:hypothetical protein
VVRSPNVVAKLDTRPTALSRPKPLDRTCARGARAVTGGVRNSCVEELMLKCVDVCASDGSSSDRRTCTCGDRGRRELKVGRVRF